MLSIFAQTGDGNAYHNFWEHPEDMDIPRIAYKIDVNSHGTEAIAKVVAALSATSIVFKKTNTNPMSCYGLLLGYARPGEKASTYNISQTTKVGVQTLLTLNLYDRRKDLAKI